MLFKLTRFLYKGSWVFILKKKKKKKKEKSFGLQEKVP